METPEWITVTLALGGVTVGVMGILFTWVRNTVIRLDEKIERQFNRLDDKLDAERRETKREIQSVRDQTQGVIKMVTERQKRHEDS